MAETNQAIGEDFDGVHTQGSDKAYEAIFENVLTEMDIFFPDDDFLGRLYAHWGAAMSSILRKDMLPDRPDLWKKGEALLKEVMMELLPDMITPVPGAAESTERLASQYTLGLISAADRDVLLQKLFPKVGLKEDYFKGGIFTADQMDPNKGQHPKPDPYALGELMSRANASPENTLMVGDSETDVLSAYYAGVEPVVTLTGNLKPIEAKSLGVRYIIEDVTRLEHEVIPRALGRTGIGRFGWRPEPAWQKPHEIAIV